MEQISKNTDKPKVVIAELASRNKTPIYNWAVDLFKQNYHSQQAGLKDCAYQVKNNIPLCIIACMQNEANKKYVDPTIKRKVRETARKQRQRNNRWTRRPLSSTMWLTVKISTITRCAKRRLTSASFMITTCPKSCYRHHLLTLKKKVSKLKKLLSCQPNKLNGRRLTKQMMAFRIWVAS